MSLHKTVAIVLGKHDLKEYDEIVSLFSPTYGQIRLVCRGTRRAKGRLRGIFELLNEVDLVYYEKEGKELGNLDQADLLDGRIRLRGRLHALGTGLLLAEVTRLAFPLHDPHPEVFSLLHSTLAELSEGAAPGLTGLRYLWRILPSIGYEADANACCCCGGSTGRDLFGFSRELGGLVCGGCLGQDVGTIRLAGPAMLLLRQLAQEAALEHDTPLSAVQAVRQALTAFLEHHLETRFRSLNFLLNVENSEP